MEEFFSLTLPKRVTVAERTNRRLLFVFAFRLKTNANPAEIDRDNCAAPYAGGQQDFHATSCSAGSTRSWLTSRWA